MKHKLALLDPSSFLSQQKGDMNRLVHVKLNTQERLALRYNHVLLAYSALTTHEAK